MRKLGATVGVVAVALLGSSTAYLKFSEIPMLEKKITQQIQVNDELKQSITELELMQLELQETNIDLLNQYKNLETEYGEAKKNFESQTQNYEQELNRYKTELQKAKEQAEKAEQKAKQVQAQPQATKSRASNSMEGFEVTYYNDYGYTKSGRFVTDNVTIAVDPNVIPLGTWVEITMPDGTVLTRRADDTGGAVKGKIIDIYMNVPTQKLYELGRVKGVKVRVLSDKA